MAVVHMKFRTRATVICTSTVFGLIVLIALHQKHKFTEEKTIHRLLGETIDNSGEYRIARFYKSTGITDSWDFYDVTIATQCSLNHLHHLVELVNRWNGPISCAVFVPNKDASYAHDAIDVLRQCFSSINKFIDFHFVYPTSHIADLSDIGSWLSLSCEELIRKLQEYGYQNYDVENIPYPHNVLRNAARTGVLTEYTLLIDIDVMPNVGLRPQLLQFIVENNLFGNKKDRTVFVLPVFEVKKDYPMPHDKNEIIQGVNEGYIRPFHNETCWWCHRVENYDLWKKIPQSDKLEVSFYANWDKSWEPFYVSHRLVPMYDERFKQYGFDRIQQICELHVAGYKFAVLNNAFLAHYGWKYAGKFYANKDDDNSQNWILFNYHFKDHLLKKYNTTRTCSPVEHWIPPAKRKFLGLKAPNQKDVVVISKFKPNVIQSNSQSPNNPPRESADVNGFGG